MASRFTGSSRCLRQRTTVVFPLHFTLHSPSTSLSQSQAFRGTTANLRPARNLTTSTFHRTRPRHLSGLRCAEANRRSGTRSFSNTPNPCSRVYRTVEQAKARNKLGVRLLFSQITPLLCCSLKPSFPPLTLLALPPALLLACWRPFPPCRRGHDPLLSIRKRAHAAEANRRADQGGWKAEGRWRF